MLKSASTVLAHGTLQHMQELYMYLLCMIFECTIMYKLRMNFDKNDIGIRLLYT